MYYVYEWFVKDTNEIFYVGKGSGNRYRNYWDRNQIFKDYYEKNQCDVRIIKEFDNEKDAFDYEKTRIDELKQNDMCKANIHIGGAGGSGEYWTDELRQEYSENNVMKRPEQRLRMSINNPMKDPEVANNVNSQKKISVFYGDRIFNSVKEACDFLNISIGTFNIWCIEGHDSNQIPCGYIDDVSIKNFRKCKPFIYKDKTYTSYQDFYNTEHISIFTLKYWLSNGFDTNGNICRRCDDKRNLVYIKPKTAKEKNSIPVIVNGVKYPSAIEADRQLGLSRGYVTRLIKGKSKSSKYICTYDNQQPSQENSGNSILEGSTTNG